MDTTEIRTQAYKAIKALTKADMRLTYFNVLTFTADGMGIEADDNDDYPEDYEQAFDKVWAVMNA